MFLKILQNSQENTCARCNVCFHTFHRALYEYSSLPNRRVSRNKRGGGKDEPFFISMVHGINMLVRILRPVAVIKKEQNELKFLIKKQKNQKNGTRE